MKMTASCASGRSVQLPPRHRRGVVDDPEEIDLGGTALTSASPHETQRRAQQQDTPSELAHLLSPLFDVPMSAAIPTAYEQAGCHGRVVRDAEAPRRKAARSGAASRRGPRGARKPP